jgi:hypothetical protein
MVRLDLGPFLYQYGVGVATLSFAPVADRGAKVRQIGITAPSATDNWVVTVEGKPIMVFRVRATGSQNIVRDDDQSSIFHSDFFNYCRQALGMDPSIPVPLGQTMTVASVGGATANVQIQFEEHDNSDLNPSLLNHPTGSEWLIPIYTYLNTGQALPGTFSDDTQVAPSWLQPFLIGTMCTSAWRLQLLAAFFQGIGVNTFSGAANHTSITRAKHIVKNGVDLFGRSVPAGIPNVGLASAAGSANTVFGQVLSSFQSFERTPNFTDNVFNLPISIQNGDTFNVREEITGDLTGTASYEPELAVWIARVSQLVGA